MKQHCEVIRDYYQTLLGEFHVTETLVYWDEKNAPYVRDVRNYETWDIKQLKPAGIFYRENEGDEWIKEYAL